MKYYFYKTLDVTNRVVDGFVVFITRWLLSAQKSFANYSSKSIDK